jgi:lipase maturation factor 1
MKNDPSKPVLLYDGDCGFCRQWILRWKRMTGESVLYLPYQSHHAEYGIPAEDCRKSVQLLEGSAHFSGAEAVLRTLAFAPGKKWLWTLYRRFPGFAPVSELAYRIVAAHRPLFSRFTPHDTIDQAKKEYFLSRWLFLRGLGAVFFFAFVSFGTQLDGLIGSQGILPAAELLEAVGLRYGSDRFFLLPTLAWFDSGDFFLRLLCSTGVVASALVLFGILTAPALLVCWSVYLSFLSISRDFLGFQWDILLLETAFLGLFMAPLHVFPEPVKGVRFPFLVHSASKWLLFRLMFSSGFVKLASGDPVWRDLTALTYHYETQPLPQVFAWYAHQWPELFHKASCGVVLFIELVLPFFIFARFS